MNSMHKRPSRSEHADVPAGDIDFLLVTVTPEEHTAIQSVFLNDLQFEWSQQGFRFRWGLLTRGGAEAATIVLANASDNQGPVNAADFTRKLTTLLRPRSLIVLGIAGAINPQDLQSAGPSKRQKPARNAGAPATPRQRITVGDIIIPDRCSLCTFKDNRPNRVSRAQQPCDLLLRAAHAASERSWLRHLPTRAVRPDKREATKANTQCITAQQLISTEELVEDVRTPRIKGILQVFPRARAVDMESGSVGATLHSLASEFCTPRFLVIKGISDDPGQASGANEASRRNWRYHAAMLSGALARELMISHPTPRRSPTVLSRLIPAESRWEHYQNRWCSGIFTGISPELYSRLSVDCLEALPKYPGKELSVFTVLNYDPLDLWHLLCDRVEPNISAKDRDNPSQSVADRVVIAARDAFPHFTAFAHPNIKRLAASSKIEVCRIVLTGCGKAELDARMLVEHWMKQGMGQGHWYTFIKLLGDVPCYFMTKARLRTKTMFLTDFVVLNRQVVIDWYDESSVAIISNILEQSKRDELLAVQRDFEEHKTQYVPIADVRKTAKGLLKW